MDWLLYNPFLLYRTTQSTLYNLPHSSVHTPSYIYIGAFHLAFAFTRTVMDTKESKSKVAKHLNLVKSFSHSNNI